MKNELLNSNTSHVNLYREKDLQHDGCHEIQIHLMLIFIMEEKLWQMDVRNSNTSHVNLYRAALKCRKRRLLDSNTSHVNLYLKFFPTKKAAMPNSNTSHVNLYLDVIRLI